MTISRKKRAALEAREEMKKRMREAHARVSDKVLAARETLARRHGNIREEVRHTNQYDDLVCELKIDRVVLTIVMFPTNSFPWADFCMLPGARVEKPERLWHKNYGSAMTINGVQGIQQIMIESDRTKHYLPPFRITLTPPDRTGLQRAALESVLTLLPNYKLVLIEVAFDFPIKSIVDMDFVRKHAVFGRSRPRFVGINPIHDSLGTRKGSKFIRSYPKWETDSHRVELEAHSRLLRHYQITFSEDIGRLVTNISARHISFKEVDTQKLVRHLRRKHFRESRINSILEQVDEKETLWDSAQYLRKRVGLKNVHRFLAPVTDVQDAIHNAVAIWTAEWEEEATRGKSQ